MWTGWPDKVDSVSGETKSAAAGVITTCTSAPAFVNKRSNIIDLYAAMLPVMARIIFLPDIIR
jgi:hypothetical protein